MSFEKHIWPNLRAPDTDDYTGCPAEEHETVEARNDKALLRGCLLATIGQLRSMPLVTFPGQDVQRRLLENITAEWLALGGK